MKNNILYKYQFWFRKIFRLLCTHWSNW